MTLPYIDEFILLAQTKKFNEAARLLSISKSTLSKHIKCLEEVLRVPLFNRNTRKVELSSFGELFLPYAQQIAKIEQECLRVISDRMEDSSNTLIIGSFHAITDYNMTDILVKFNELFSPCRIKLVQGDSNQLKVMLRQNECEIIFAREDDIKEKEFERIEYTTDRIAALLPINHPLAKSKTISIVQLKDEPFVMFPKDTYMYNRCLNICQLAGFNPHIVFTIFGQHNLVDLVGKGMGVSLLLKKPAILHNNRNVSVVDIEPPIVSSINILYMKVRILSVAAQRFLEIAKTLIVNQ